MGRTGKGRVFVSGLPMFFLLSLVALMIMGLFTLYSADVGGRLFYKQLTWDCIGLVIMFMLSMIDVREIEYYSHIIYSISLVLLALIFVMGKSVMGAKRQLYFGLFAFQPSELAKLALIFAMARILSHQDNAFGMKSLWKPFFILIPPFLLTLVQPDLGTALILMAIAGTMVLVCGIKKRAITVLALVALLAVPLALHSLRPYQKERVKAFCNPKSMATSAGYHVIQSRIAIGSGGIWGRGFSQGSQSRLLFIPVKHTDFIFSVFAEERGFVGVSVLLAAYLSLVFFALSSALRAKDLYSFYVAVGVAFLFVYHVVVNIGMTMGLLPVVGVPLPFMSYGGSFAVVSYVGAGLILATYRGKGR